MKQIVILVLDGGFVMPGWEPNRRDEIMDLFDKYKDVTADKLRENYKVFLDGIPSGSGIARSVRVQSNTGIKL